AATSRPSPRLLKPLQILRLPLRSHTSLDLRSVVIPPAPEDSTPRAHPGSSRVRFRPGLGAYREVLARGVGLGVFTRQVSAGGGPLHGLRASITTGANHRSPALSQGTPRSCTAIPTAASSAS